MVVFFKEKDKDLFSPVLKYGKFKQASSNFGSLDYSYILEWILSKIAPIWKMKQ